jgi:hypothetical protein
LSIKCALFEKIIFFFRENFLINVEIKSKKIKSIFLLSSCNWYYNIFKSKKIKFIEIMNYFLKLHRIHWSKVFILISIHKCISEFIISIKKYEFLNLKWRMT